MNKEELEEYLMAFKHSNKAVRIKRAVLLTGALELNIKVLCKKLSIPYIDSGSKIISYTKEQVEQVRELKNSYHSSLIAKKTGLNTLTVDYIKRELIDKAKLNRKSYSREKEEAPLPVIDKGAGKPPAVYSNQKSLYGLDF